MLVTSPDASGGIARATATLANRLSDTHERRDDRPVPPPAGERFDLDPRVKVRCIVDEATPQGATTRAISRPRRPVRTARESYSALVDKVLPRILACARSRAS